MLACGITGDVAKMMFIHSLYRLERRGLLDCSIVASSWTTGRRTNSATMRGRRIEGTGETIDSKVFDRLAKCFSYVQGDFVDGGTYQRLAKEIAGVCTGVFYLEAPPSSFGDGRQGPH